ncbi:FkbM family methyltransferase [Neorhizobium sp. T7_12]|uniref:FkbM family methyltransferase n=1 Tax=Neorhizobium sp. T7_12 TaxID=2093832 RepID=UPI000CF89DD9|nr:FkbM family methyltransferase [Neorhizobium sp. T7_12]
MKAKHAVYRVANGFFEYGYPVYFPLYSGWKAFADRRERALIRGILRRGMTVIDIGANIGVYTRFLSRGVGSSGEVHAFEPSELNFLRLGQSASKLNNVFLNQAAVGDRSGTTTLFVSQELNVDHRTFDSGDGRKEVPVRVIALDDHFSPAKRIDFMKIDVQGFELSVLKGATRILKENRDLKILMEFWPFGLNQASTSARELIDFARDLGFSVEPVPNSGSPSIETMLAAPVGLENYWNVVLSRT